ncbi:MAG: VOC family protein [Actinobacteria bacterium]|nr:VOC family protein [Actinomycetota bacterium]
MRIDHVVMAVRDLDAAAERLWEDHGLASVSGGHHPAWGTANRIVPLGEDYVELLAVVDPSVGASTVLGRTLLDLSAGGDRWFSACLATDDIGSTAERLGLDVVPGSRTRPDGSVIAWRGAGIEAPSREPWLPFFISWDVPSELHPGRAVVEHRVPVTGIARVEVAGDDARMRGWLGGADVPIRVVDAAPKGVREVAIATAGGNELMIAR